MLLKDIVPGPASPTLSGFTVLGDKLIFSADDKVHGVEPWVTDGTPAGTVLVKDINLNGSSNPSALTQIDIINSPPSITSNGGGSTALISVAENSTAVTTVTATDPNPWQTLTYSIAGGPDAALFTIGSQRRARFCLGPQLRGARVGGRQQHL